jgi:hypothetical protein
MSCCTLFISVRVKLGAVVGLGGWAKANVKESIAAMNQTSKFLSITKELNG